ncbi:MAG: phage tail protein [Defluviitaleaceae bacterium]|nr:phage tail protein [Defluviitaleaceae bacterium]
MGNANIPQVYTQNMERLALLDKATAIGYTQIFNGIWTAGFTLPADDPKNEYCQPFNYVEIYDEKRRIELFRIKGEDLTRSTSGFKTYKCEHVIATLIDDPLFMFHQIGNIGVFTREVINYVLNAQTSPRWVLGRCDFTHQFLYKWESVNLLAALFSIPRPFADKWHFTYDTTVYPWVINLVRPETEISCELRRKKNMQGVTRHTDVTNLVTRLYPLGYGEGDNQLTIKGVNGGVPYIDATTIPQYGIKAAIWTDRRFEDEKSLLATGQSILDELSVPYVTYSVDSIDLFKRTKQDFDKFEEGRLVRVIDRHDNIDIDTRIVEISKPDVTKADINIVIANKDRNVAGSIVALQDRARINDTYSQGSETLIPMNFTDNAEPAFPAVFEFFLPGSMVNINEARLRVQLLPFRAFSRAVRGGGGFTQTSTSGGGVSTSTAAGGATTQTTTQQATQTQTTSTTSTQTPTTSTISTQTPTTSTISTQTPTTSTTNTETPTTSTTSTETPTTSFDEARLETTTVDAGGLETSTQDNTRDVWQLGISAGSEMVSSPVGGINVPSHWHALSQHTHTHTHFVQIGPHSHRVTIPRHQHSVTIPGHSHFVTIWGHSHSVTIDGHSHTVTINGHSHTVTIDGHSHTVTIPEHGHSVTIPNHDHLVVIPDHYHVTTIPDHTHELEFGIFTGTRATAVSIRVDGNIVPLTGNLNDINIIPFLRRDSGGRIARDTWHTLELIPNTLTRISASLFLNIFTNSRGGANL